MKIGVVQFGNGEITCHGIISHTSDIASAKAAIEGMEYKKGFTNMAQALTLAERIALLSGCRAVQQAVMMITDGKPSFLFQTQEKMQMKDTHTKLFLAPVVEDDGDEPPS